MKQTLKNIVTGAALATSFAGGVHAQESEGGAQRPEALVEVSPELSLDYHVIADSEGVSSQNLFDFQLNNESKIGVKGMVESLPSGNMNYGLDLSNTHLRLNLGYGVNHDGENPWRVLGTATFEDGFFGAKYQHLGNGDDVFSVHGGVSLTDRLDVRATLGTEGGSVVGFYDLDNGGAVGIGGGVSDRGEWDVNISYSDATKWAYIRGGSEMSLDARLVLGDINPKQIKYVFNVTGSGNNERDDLYDDVTFRFGIGQNARTKLDYFGANGVWLADEAGSSALNLRLIEGNRAIAEYAVRPADGVTVMGGLRAELERGGFDIANYGIQGQLGLDIGKMIGLPDNSLNMYLNGWADKDGNVEGAVGLGGKITF